MLHLQAACLTCVDIHRPPNAKTNAEHPYTLGPIGVHIRSSQGPLCQNRVQHEILALAPMSFMSMRSAPAMGLSMRSWLYGALLCKSTSSLTMLVVEGKREVQHALLHGASRLAKGHVHAVRPVADTSYIGLQLPSRPGWQDCATACHAHGRMSQLVLSMGDSNAVRCFRDSYVYVAPAMQGAKLRFEA